MIEQEVIDLIESSESAQDYRRKASQVKEAFGGYPRFWFDIFLKNERLEKILNRWGETAKLQISVEPIDA